MRLGAESDREGSTTESPPKRQRMEQTFVDYPVQLRRLKYETSTTRIDYVDSSSDEEDLFICADDEDCSVDVNARTLTEHFIEHLVVNSRVV